MKPDIEGLRERVTANTGAVDGLKKDTSVSMEALKKDVTSTVDGLKKEVSGTTDQVKKDEAQTEILKDRLAMVESLKKDVATIDVLKDKVATATADLKAMRDEMAKLQQVEERTRSTDLERKASQDLQLKQVEDSLKDMQKALQDCREKLGFAWRGSSTGSSHTTRYARNQQAVSFFVSPKHKRGKNVLPSLALRASESAQASSKRFPLLALRANKLAIRFRIAGNTNPLEQLFRLSGSGTMSRRRPLLLSLGIIALVLLAASSVLGFVIKREPAFYTAATRPGSYETREKASRLMTRVQDLKNDIRTKGEWGETFTVEELNCFFAEMMSGKRSFKTACRAKKISLAARGEAEEQNRLKIGFRYGEGFWSTVVWIDLHIWLVADETNLMAVEVCNLKAGQLGIGAQSILDAIADTARESNIDVIWYRYKGNPVGLFRFFPDQPRPATQFQTLAVEDGKIVIAGKSIASGMRVAAPGKE